MPTAPSPRLPQLTCSTASALSAFMAHALLDHGSAGIAGCLRNACRSLLYQLLSNSKTADATKTQL